MPLLTARDFPGINAVPDESGLARGVFTALQGLGQMKAKQQEQKALETAKKLDINASLALSFRELASDSSDPKQREAGYQRQRAAIARTLRKMAEQGEDISLFERYGVLDAETPDDLNVRLMKVMGESAKGRDFVFAQAKAGIGDAANFQYGGQDLFEDEAGNKFYGTSRRDPNPRSGKVESVLTPLPGNNSDTPIGEISKVSDSGLTPEGKVKQSQQITENQERIKTRENLIRKRDELNAELEIKPDITREVELQKINAQLASDAFTQARKLMLSERTYNRAIELVKGDPSITGPIDSMWPSFSAAAIELDNIGQSLGLDLIAMGSFGPLNESELKLALETVLPPLDGPELVTWLEKQRDYKLALASELRNYAIHLSRGGSQEEYLNKPGGGKPNDPLGIR